MERLSAASTCWKGALIVGSLLAYILAIALNAVLNIPGISPFNETIGDLSHKYSTPITPTDSTFAIWGAIYLWQLVLIVYCMTLMCRKCQGSPLYIFPGVVPATFFFSYIINLTAGNPGWIFVWLEERLISAMALLVLGVVTLVICLASSCRELESSGADMVANGLQADIWCTRIIVQNGIAFYLAWVSCATTINTFVVLHYVLGIEVAQASWGCLIALTVFIIGWFVLELAADRQLRYVFAHYITYIVAFAGIYKENYDPNVNYEIYAFVLLFVVSALALAKLIIIIVRSIKDPIHYPKQHDKVAFKPLKAPINTVQR